MTLEIVRRHEKLAPESRFEFRLMAPISGAGFWSVSAVALCSDEAKLLRVNLGSLPGITSLEKNSSGSGRSTVSRSGNMTKSRAT